MGLAVTLAGAAVIVFLFDPAASRFFPPCPFYVTTGLYCPGCGSLRAIHRLLHGNLAGALAMNPLMITSLPVLGLLLLRRSWSYQPWLAWPAVAVLVMYGILRNIDAWPFILLAPQ